MNNASYETASSCSVVWHTPSEDASGSMPLGGGDIGLNVWCEGGDVLFYLARSGAYDENNQLLKLGRVRLRLAPGPFADSPAFRQVLHPDRGLVEIHGAHADAGNAVLRIWVEVDRPVVHVELTAEQPVGLEAVYENWRHRRRIVEDRHPCASLIDYPGEVCTFEDEVEYAGGGVRFRHRNRAEASIFPKELELQGLSAYRERIRNPLDRLIFGGCMQAEGLTPGPVGQGVYQGIDYRFWTLQGRRRETHLTIALHMAAAEPPQWEAELASLAAAAGTELDSRRERHLAWWRAFGERSWIRIRPDSADPSDPVWQVGRNYQLFRFMLACNATGSDPTKFNGGLFTFDPHLVNERHRGETPDYRMWGGGTFTAQNQRLVYWPMLKSGDFAMMQPQFDFYRRALPAAELRSEVYWGHGGCSFTEQLNNTGLPSSREYGWHRRPELDPGVEDSAWVSYEYVHQLDFAFMMLEYARYSEADIGVYMPFIRSAVRFFDEHYRFRNRERTGAEFDERGRYVIYPSTALETFKDAMNPADVVAGLQAVLRRLTELPDALADDSERAFWFDMLARLPALPMEEKNGVRTIAPAQSWSHVQNQEIPQLYAVFPFDLYGLGKPDLAAAIDTWRYSIYHDNQKSHVSWHQGGIFCARLGLTEEAAGYAIRKLADGPHRFPAFWGPGHDWTPDHNWGGSGMIGLQDMLMQTSGEDIWLMPAWPPEWDVDFKLHAPQQTVVEGAVRSGRLERLDVTPSSRRKDVRVGADGHPII